MSLCSRNEIIQDDEPDEEWDAPLKQFLYVKESPKEKLINPNKLGNCNSIFLIYTIPISLY